MNQIIINLSNLEHNIKQIKNHFKNYTYYMAVVKSNAYGLGIEAIKVIAKYCNYLVVSNIEEAIVIRNEHITLPILVLEPIQSNQIDYFEKYQLSATIEDCDVLASLQNTKIPIHIKVNTGMNRFGFSSTNDVLNACSLINQNNLLLEGIYTHLYYVDNKAKTCEQIEEFKNILSQIPSSIPIVHVFNSQALCECEKLDFANGVRIGDLIYGLKADDALKLQSTFSLKTHILSIRKVHKGETVGYDGGYPVLENSVIAVLPIGYSQGLTKNHIGTNVYIHNRPYPIIGNTMNQTFIKVDETVHKNDIVDIYKDTFHLLELSQQLKTVPQELMLILDKNIDKKYEKQ